MVRPLTVADEDRIERERDYRTCADCGTWTGDWFTDSHGDPYCRTCAHDYLTVTHCATCNTWLLEDEAFGALCWACYKAARRAS